MIKQFCTDIVEENPPTFGSLAPGQVFLYPTYKDRVYIKTGKSAITGETYRSLVISGIDVGYHASFSSEDRVTPIDCKLGRIG